MRAITFVAATLFGLLVGANAMAQPRSGQMIVERNWTDTVEDSLLEQSISHFGSMFWSVNPAVGWTDGNSAAQALSLRMATRESYQRLANAARRNCDQLTRAQRLFLRSLARAQFSSIQRDTIARSSVETRDRIVSARLEFQDGCEAVASADGAIVRLDDALILSAVLVALSQSTQYFAAPDRVGAMIDEERSRFGSTHWNEAEGTALLSRVEQSRVWRHMLRAMRAQLATELPAASVVPLAIFDGMASNVSADCRGQRTECELQTKLGVSFTAVLKFDVYLREQIAFLLAHEMAHVVLGHAALEAASPYEERCAVRLRLELEADSFAASFVTTMLPTGQANGGQEFRMAFAQSVDTGVELFLVDTFRVAGLGGAQCGYLSSQQRLEHLGVRSAAPPDFSPIIGVWEGRYFCGRGAAGIRIDIRPNNAELFANVDFYPLPTNLSVAPGALRMNGLYDPASNSMALTEEVWISRPPGYTMPDIQGVFTSRDAFSGKLAGPGCGDITVRRVARASSEPPRSSASASIYGIWTGTYFCGQGATGARLTIEEFSGAPRGRFEFYSVRGGQNIPSGTFEMSGSYDEQAAQLDLRGTRWIVQPAGMRMLDMSGRFDFASQTFEGEIENRGCGRFVLARQHH